MNKRGREPFDHYYREIYGDRWDRLANSLEKEISYGTIEHFGCPSYFLDRASIAAVESARPISGNVLDLCAAPGGKSLALLLFGSERLSLTANERSRMRRERLKRVFDEYLPDDVRSRVRVTGHDARRWSLYERSVYDLVLLDAPCSGERHLLRTPSELAKWTASRTKRLATESFAMLASALDVVRPGGSILFSTCTISPIENDDIVARLERKRPGRIIVAKTEQTLGEATKYGRMILPDRYDGMGPIYYSLIIRAE